MIVLVGGGVRSGKSAFALARARELARAPVFLATAEGKDAAMAERIARHVRDRGGALLTVEEPLDVPEAVERIAATPGPDAIVLDCLTLWISNLLCAGKTEAEVEARVGDLVRALGRCSIPAIVVSNEVGMGVHPESELGILFRDVVGRAHQSIAAHATEIYVAVLGTVLRLKPGPVTAISPGGPP
ncbi:MAG: bifunctional adenosylcobinamide kinase/adenosylcobinamide-phosphate guanylyltransferase [Acidobacteriota bacterium]